MSDERKFDWENRYKSLKGSEMPWYNPELDKDLQKVLEKLKIVSGTFLDLGTGPATQAKKLADMGFKVTGTDISEEAIRLAKETFNGIEFLQDDILNTSLTKSFDYILDRGCFHVIVPEKREIYAGNVIKLLNDSGRLFIKCFSNRMPETGHGPYLISEQIVSETFENKFIIEEIFETEFSSAVARTIKALFVTLRKR